VPDRPPGPAFTEPKVGDMGVSFSFGPPPAKKAEPALPPEKPTKLSSGLEVGGDAKAALDRMAGIIARDEKERSYAKDPEDYELLDPARESAIVSRGSEPAVVFALQKALIKAMYPVKVNGTFDPDVELAVRSLQRDNGVTVTGKVDSATMEALDRILNVRPRTKVKRTEQPLPDVPTTDNEFIDSISSGAIRAQRETGVPASISIAMAVLLSGWGERDMAAGQNNLYMLEGEGTAGTVVYKSPQTGRDTSYRAYHTRSESVMDHARFMVGSDDHRKRLANRPNPEAAARALTDLYPSVPQLGETMVRIMKQFRLGQFDRLE
jgi:flagellum-specific peptidoglycan hydrolase FlgJ